MRYQDTLLNETWRAEMLAKSSQQYDWAPAIKRKSAMNATVACAMAKILIEEAKLDEFDLAVLNLPSGWEDLGKLPVNAYTKVVAAALFGGVGIPQDFKRALLQGEVAVAGRLSNKYPRAAMDGYYVRAQRPEAQELVNTETGRLVKFLVLGGMTSKTRKAWEILLQGVNVQVVRSPEDLMQKFYGDLQITREMASAFVRLHFPIKSDVDPATLRFTHGRYDDIIQVRVTQDPKYANYFEFALNGEVLKKYTSLSGKLDGLHPYRDGGKDTHDGVNAFKTFTLVLYHVLTGSGTRGMLGRLAYLTDAWLEKETGACFGSRAEAIRRGKVAVLALQATNAFGFQLVNGSGENRKAVIRELSAAGIPSIPHHQMSWVTAGTGAQARGVGITRRQDAMGRKIHSLVLFSKADKATKMVNRMALAKPTAYVDGKVESALKIHLSTGEAVTLEGIKVTTAYANCGLLVNGSGNSISNPDFTVTVRCPKQVFKTEIVLGMDSTEADAAFAALDLEFPESGKTGDPMIVYQGDTRVKFTLFEGEFQTVAPPVWKFNKDTYRLEVSVTVSWSYVSSTEKLAGDGVKARFTPEALDIKSANGDVIAQPQVFLTQEELKGTQGLVAMWAESVPGGVVYYPNNGLTEEQQAAFQAWVLASTKVVTIRRQVNDIHYSNLKKLYKNDSSYVFEDDNWITWTGDVVFGEIVLAVEYSTTFQAEGTSEVFPELMYSLNALNRNFCYLWEEKTTRRRLGAFHGLTHMVGNKHTSEEEPPVIDLAGPNPVILELEDLVDEEGNMPSHGKDYLKALAAKYPIGFYVQFGGLKQYIDPDALEMLTGNAGTLSAVTSNVVDLVKYFLLPQNKRPGRTAAGQIQSYLKLFRKASAAMMTASNVMKKPFRSGRLLTRKVSTTCRFGVNAWELHVNPNDSVVLNGELEADQVVGSARVPVIFWGAFKVVLDEKTPIGVFEVDAYCWAAVNEGDSDGDGIAVLILPKSVKIRKNGKVQEIFPQQMLWDACHTIHANGNTSRMSASGLWTVAPGEVTALTGGYTAMYGADFNNHPYAEFLQQPAKKNISNLVAGEGGVGVFNSMLLPLYSDAENPETLSYSAVVDGIQTHYTNFVGASYGIATIALYLFTLAWDEGNMERANDLIPLLVFLGRFVHEGKHLGGMNESATKFWIGMGMILRTGKLVVADDQGLEKKIEGIAALRYLVENLLGGKEIAADGLHLTDRQLELLITLRKIAIVGNSVDREDENIKLGSEKLWDVELIEWARLFRLCRLVGKGQVTRIGENEQLSDTMAIRSALDGGQGYALVDRLNIAGIEAIASGTLLGKVAKAAYNIHKTVVNTVRAEIQQAANNPYDA